MLKTTVSHFKTLKRNDNKINMQFWTGKKKAVKDIIGKVMQFLIAVV